MAHFLLGMDDAGGHHLSDTGEGFQVIGRRVPADLLTRIVVALPIFAGAAGHLVALPTQEFGQGRVSHEPAARNPSRCAKRRSGSVPRAWI
jgi:hypothetical protein